MTSTNMTDKNFSRALSSVSISAFTSITVKLTLCLAFFLSVGCWLSQTASPAFGATQSIDARIAAEERKRNDLNKRIADYKKRIKDMGTKVDGLLGQIDTLKQNEAVAAQEVEILELQQQKIQEDIDFLDAEMDREQQKITELAERMEDRLVDMYKYGTSEEMNLFFGSQSVFEAVEAVHLMNIIARHDEDLLTQLQLRYQNLQLSQQTMDNHNARLEKQTEELNTQRETYQKSIQKTNSFISNIQKQKADAEKAAREAEDAQKAVGNTITSLRKKKQDEAAAAKKKSAGSKPSSSSTGADYLAGKARGSMFDWPVRGTITSNVGTRVHPVFKTKTTHTGLDIAAPANTPVKAAAAGEVLFVGWLKGYGQVIILDHGRDYSTVYAHLNSASVKEGQVVKANTVIGRVGKTGTATGYHLHFEVRVGSVVKNPLDYLKK